MYPFLGFPNFPFLYWKSCASYALDPVTCWSIPVSDSRCTLYIPCLGAGRSILLARLYDAKFAPHLASPLAGFRGICARKSRELMCVGQLKFIRERVRATGGIYEIERSRPCSEYQSRLKDSMDCFIPLTTPLKLTACVGLVYALCLLFSLNLTSYSYFCGTLCGHCWMLTQRFSCLLFIHCTTICTSCMHFFINGIYNDGVLLLPILLPFCIGHIEVPLPPSVACQRFMSPVNRQ